MKPKPLPFILAATAMLIAGCLPGEDVGWGSGGSEAGEIEDEIPEDTAVEQGDTDDGWPDPVDADGPSLMNEECYVEEYPGYGWVLFCQGDVKDDQDDVVGGKLKLSVAGGAYGDGYSGEFPIDDAEGSGDACEACYSDEFLYFSVQDADDDEDFEIWFQLVDKQGNRGNEVEVTLLGQ